MDVSYITCIEHTEIPEIKPSLSAKLSTKCARQIYHRKMEQNLTLLTKLTDMFC